MRIQQQLSNIWSLLWALRAVLATSILCSAALVLPEQIIELYAIHLQEIAALPKIESDLHVAQTIAIPICLAILTIILLACGVSSLKDYAGNRNDDDAAKVSPAALAFLLLVACLPMVSLSYGIDKARQLELSGAARAEELLLTIWAIGALAGFTLLFVLLLWRPIRKLPAGHLVNLPYLLLLLVITASVTWAFAANPIKVPEFIGSIAIVLLFFSLLSIWLSTLANVFDRYRIPALSLLLVLAVSFSYQGVNDNHRVASSTTPERPKALKSSFTEWLLSRPDRHKYEAAGKPYPVYLVSAAGGGAFAAFHTASTLAHIQDHCPSFSKHLFAISSVSGGSLGAAVFAGLVHRQGNAGGETGKCNEAEVLNAAPGADNLSSKVDRFFERDFLSPLVGATLFPDFAQRFLPTPFYSWDRGASLERSFAAAWRSTDRASQRTTNFFTINLMDSWTPSGAAPVLLINTTGLETGARVTLAPLRFDATPTTLHISDAFAVECVPGKNGESSIEQVHTVNLSIGAAVSLSARFPWISPIGWLQREGKAFERTCEPAKPELFGNRIYLADGGYFENNGLELLHELRLRLMESVRISRKIPFDVTIKVIPIYSRHRFASRWWQSDGDLSEKGSGELIGPVKLLLNMRRARTRAAHSRTSYFDANYWRTSPESSSLETGDIPTPLRWMYDVVLDGREFFLPLGWRLSRATKKRIRQQLNKKSDPGKISATQRAMRLIAQDLNVQAEAAR